MGRRSGLSSGAREYLGGEQRSLPSNGDWDATASQVGIKLGII